MDALWFPAADARYSTIKAAHTRTCTWMLQRPEYQDWFDANKSPRHHGLLWIKGKPGSGKSTLMKFIVANARKMEGDVVVISFFFNARGEDLEKSTLGMYRSLLHQFLKALPELQTILKDFESCFPREGGSCTLEEEDLERTFITAIQNLKQHCLICFIDALDECDEDEIRDLVVFLENLGQIAISSQIRFNVYLSSRHYPYISIKNGVQLILEGQEGHVQDIAKYLNSKLRAGNGKQSDAIKEEILTRASGIFLWVALIVQILNKEYDHGRVHALRRRLKEIPDGLDKLFDDILTRDRENTEELVLCLQWVLYAKQPLKREELYYAILSGTDHEMLSVSHPDGVTVQDMERFILSCSKGLAETTKLKAQTVQFIHESVRDFLLGKTGFNKLKLELRPSQSQERLKQCCCIYMKADVSKYLPPSMALPVASTFDGDLRKLISKNFPFLEYAVRNVLFHADNADGHGISQYDFIEKFALGNWIMLDNLFEKYQIRRHTSNASLLYICAEKNLSNLIRTQLKWDPHPETAGERFENERYGAPLYAALANAKVSEATVGTLLSPLTQTSDFVQELHHAYSGCDFDCLRAAIKTIIRCRPNLDPRKKQYLIGWAASEGHEAVVKILLARDDIDVNVIDLSHQTPLLKAASNGHDTVVKLLLAKQNIDLNFQDINIHTPLSLATLNGHDAVVKLLLEKHDVDSNSKNTFGRTPLSLAALNGHNAVVKMLLARQNTDPNSKDLINRTPLSFAALNWHGEVIESLLAHDNVIPDSKDYFGLTPLLLAVSQDREKPIDRGRPPVINVNSNLSQDYRFQLMLLEQQNRKSRLNGVKGSSMLEAIKPMLEDENIDLNATDNSGRTVLLWAASDGHEDLVKQLLANKNVKPDLRDFSARTPLSWAASNGHESIANLLLARQDVDPNSKDNNNQTPLLLAASNGYDAVVKLLRARLFL